MNGYGRSTEGFGIDRMESVRLIVRVALEEGVTDHRQIAYMLATAQHESDNFTAPEEHFGRSQARKLDYRGGEEYFGRGYVHLTHVDNYEKFDRLLGLEGALVRDPALAKNPELAARILVIGMRDGLFTGKALGRYIDEDSHDLYNARRTVNGIVAEKGWSVRAAEHCRKYAEEWEKEVPALMADAASFKGVPFALPELRPLNFGERSHDVAVLQEKLNRLGATEVGHALKVDGHFGERTREALSSFQQMRGLPDTGIADVATLRLVDSSVSSPDPVKDFNAFTGQFKTVGERSDWLTIGRDGFPNYLSSRFQQESLGERAGPVRPGESGQASSMVAGSRTSDCLQKPVPAHDPGHVRGVQGQLIRLGYTDESGRTLSVDGKLGPHTREAVARFQGEKGLPITGLPDEKTREAIGAYAVVADLEQRKAERDRQTAAQAQAAAHAEPGPTSGMAQVTPASLALPPTFMDTAHPDHPLFRGLRERLPPEVTDLHVAALTFEAKRNRIGSDRIDKVGVHQDNAYASGLDIWSGMARVNFRQPAPSIEEVMGRSDALDQEQSQRLVPQPQRRTEPDGRVH